jgi:GGDEF domain-containing protein
MDIKRSPDMLGHLNNQGLAILMPETERKSADRLAIRISTMIQGLDVADWTNWKPLKFRIGLAGAPDDATTLTQLVSEALKNQIVLPPQA